MFGMKKELIYMWGVYTPLDLRTRLIHMGRQSILDEKIFHSYGIHNPHFFEKRGYPYCWYNPYVIGNRFIHMGYTTHDKLEKVLAICHV